MGAPAERVWALVSGIPHPARAKRGFLVLQAWFDAGKDFRYFALCGYVAPVENWADFSTDWKAILDWCHPPFEPLGVFKMSQMNLTYAPDFDRCAALYGVIERYVQSAVVVTIKLDDLVSAVKGLLLPRSVTKQRELKNPYFLALTGVYDTLLKHPETIPAPVEVLFDSQSEYDRVMKAWRDASAVAPAGSGFSRMKGSPPSFRDDASHLPLQAADLLAWWVRKWESEGAWGEQNPKFLFPWKTAPMLLHYLRLQEPDITANLRAMFNV